MADMAPLESVAGQIEWAGKNFAYNLDFIPDDKLDWKPAPTANSALEVAQHVARAVGGLQGALQGQEPAEVTMPADRAAAKQLVLDATSRYAAWARTVTAEQVAQEFDPKFMPPMPFGRFATVALVDTLHHHGQIAYIQTLLGDTESHFMENAF